MHGINQGPSVKVHSREYCQQIVLYQCMKIASWWALPTRRAGLASCGCFVFAYHALPSVPASLILGENCTERHRHSEAPYIEYIMRRQLTLALHTCKVQNSKENNRAAMYCTSYDYSLPP